MTNARLFSIAVAAMLALTAIAASAATAGTYDSTVKTTFLTGSNTEECANSKAGETEENKCKKGTKSEEEETWHAFQTGFKFICKMVMIKGQQVGTEKAKEVFTTTSVTVHPEYTLCTIAGWAVTVNTTGCDYTFGEPTGAASSFAVSNVKIVCEAGKDIVFTATTVGCTIKIPAQTLTSTSTVANLGAGATRELTFSLNLSKIRYTSSGGICGASGEAGAYVGKVKVKGFSNEAHTTQVGIFATA